MKKFLCAAVVVMSLCTFAHAEPDLDLTKFSSVMTYSSLMNILADPSAFIGKVIKLNGKFEAFHDDETGNDYFGVTVSDTSACCVTGLDFVLKDTRKYPEDYPKNGETITVSGRFEMYREGEEVFCRLVDAEII